MRLVQQPRVLTLQHIHLALLMDRHGHRPGQRPGHHHTQPPPTPERPTQVIAHPIVVTHDIASANFVADRMAFLYDGKIHRVASADDMRASTDPMISAFLSGGQSGA